jgi:hypothetical protein
MQKETFFLGSRNFQRIPAAFIPRNLSMDCPLRQSLSLESLSQQSTGDNKRLQQEKRKRLNIDL